MDVSFYISELLDLHGDISVPGLGHLVQARISGYYNEAEQKFYPPHHEVQFEPQLLDQDNILIQYIADKKNISLASSQYFTEKYINNLKEEALTQEVPVASIGWFYTKGDQLAFRAASKLTNDPAFYGLPSIKINKLGSAPVVEPAPAPQPEPTYSPNMLIPESAENNIAEEEEESYYEEPQARNLMRIWLIVLSVILLIAIIAFALYKYQPETFERLTTWRSGMMKAPPVKAEPELKVVDTVQVDTTDQPMDTVATQTPIVNKADSVAIAKKNPAPVINKVIKITEVTKTTTPPVEKPIASVPPTVTKEVKTTTKTITTAPPVVKNTPKPVVATPVVTTIPKGRRFEVIANSTSSVAEANRLVSEYKAQGIDAHIAKGVTGVGIKVSVGTYSSLDAAEVGMTKLIESGKIHKDSYPIEIKQ